MTSLHFWNGLSGMPQHGIDRNKNILFPTPTGLKCLRAADCSTAWTADIFSVCCSCARFVFEVQRAGSILHRCEEQKFAPVSLLWWAVTFVVLFNSQQQSWQSQKCKKRGFQQMQPSLALLTALCSGPEGLLRVSRGGTKDMPGAAGRSCSSWSKPELSKERQCRGGFRTRGRTMKLGTTWSTQRCVRPRSLGYSAFPCYHRVWNCSLSLVIIITWAALDGLKSRSDAASRDAPQTFGLTQRFFSCKILQSCQPLHLESCLVSVHIFCLSRQRGLQLV